MLEVAQPDSSLTSFLKRQPPSNSIVKQRIDHGRCRWVIILCPHCHANANYLRRPIASAVVLPEAEASTAPLKRRQSSASDSTSKRPRLSLDASSRSPPTLRDSPKPIESSKPEPEVKPE